MLKHRLADRADESYVERVPEAEHRAVLDERRQLYLPEAHKHGQNLVAVGSACDPSPMV